MNPNTFPPPILIAALIVAALADGHAAVAFRHALGTLRIRAARIGGAS